MTIVESTRLITGGVDTHLDVHVAAAVDVNGGVLGVESFATTPAGYVELYGWLAGFGTVDSGWGEGTGVYGAGLRVICVAEGLVVIEVDRPNRQERRRNGKSDELDAIEAARAALSGRASGIAKSADGDVEAIRALLVARRSGRDVRIKYLNQIRHLGFTAPDELRERLRDVPARPLGAHRRGVASHRRAPTASCTRRNSRSRRWAGACSRSRLTADASTSVLDHSCSAPRRACSRSTASAPTPPRSCSSPRATTRTGSQSEAAFAHLCGVAPLPASSGKTKQRFRLNPGGNRQANHALWRIVFTRMSNDERTRKYVARRTRRRTFHPRGHAHLEALRRPRALPPSRARLTRSGVTGLAHECPDTHRLSFERTAGPSLPNTFGTAWPHKSLPSPEWPITGLPAPPKQPLTNIGASISVRVGAPDQGISALTSAVSLPRTRQSADVPFWVADRGALRRVRCAFLCSDEVRAIRQWWAAVT